MRQMEEEDKRNMAGRGGGTHLERRYESDCVKDMQGAEMKSEVWQSWRGLYCKEWAESEVWTEG